MAKFYAKVDSSVLADDHDDYWRRVLDSQEPIVLNRPEVSARMPYARTQADYTAHVDGCAVCQNQPIWSDECATGTRLAGLASDACAAQEDLAAQN